MTPAKSTSKSISSYGALQRSKATPAPVERFVRAKSPIKSSPNYSLSKDDIEKIFRELIRKEFARLGIHLEEENVSVPEQVEDNKDDNDPMDIDLVRLENASSRSALQRSKDLLAMEGRVEGTDVQVLADTCANLSWIPKFLADELGMEIDASKTHRIKGVSGDEKSLGIVKDGLIELATGCVIKEDLAVVNYTYREIGLSRPCLRGYNYDVHESREHIALTCDEKNFFIPIVPDKNRSKSEE
jgi:Aspartyl protease